MKKIVETDVLVLGAGPVGMFTALWLSQRGLSVRVIDKYSRTALHSYALALHPQTLRMMDELALADDLVGRGQVLERIVVHHGCGEPTELEVAPVGGPHPYVVVLPQLLLEGALEQRLEQNGVPIHWRNQALVFDTDDRGATTVVARMPEDLDEPGPGDITTYRVRSTFLIGADGYGSLTRRMLSGETTIGDPTIVGLMELERPIDDPSRSHLVLGPRTTDVFWPLGPDRGRWSVEMDDAEDADDSVAIRRAVAARAPWFAADVGAVEWCTPFQFKRRLSRRFGRGPVWLVGDAARFTSPIGVQSMNVGLREGYDLARRMAGILREERSPELLDYYNEERRREWKMLLGLDDRIETRDDAPNWARERSARLVRSLPASGQDLNVLLGQVGLHLNWLRRRDKG